MMVYCNRNRIRFSPSGVADVAVSVDYTWMTYTGPFRVKTLTVPNGVNKPCLPSRRSKQAEFTF
jgi:hypothetical protein